MTQFIYCTICLLRYIYIRKQKYCQLYIVFCNAIYNGHFINIITNKLIINGYS